jgi:preprotein translocase subunit Sss1
MNWFLKMLKKPSWWDDHIGLFVFVVLGIILIISFILDKLGVVL